MVMPIYEKCKYSDFCNNEIFMNGLKCDSINFFISVDKKECALYPLYNEWEKNMKSLEFYILNNLNNIKDLKLIVAFIIWLKNKDRS